MLDEATKISHKIISESKKKGMDEIELFIAYNDQKQVIINGTSVSTQRARDELGVGIRVIQKGAEGFSYTNIITYESLSKAASEAFSVAKMSPKIEGLALPVKKSVKQIKETYNDEIVSLEADTLTKDAIGFIKGFTSVDERIKTVLSSITTNVSEVAILNSNDLEVTRKSTNYQGGFLCVASDKDKAGGYVNDSVFSRKHDIDTEAIGIELGKRAIDGLKQETINTFEGSIIFKENAMSNPIAIVSSLACSGDWRQRGISFWKDKLADKVADEQFSLYDKPHDLKGGAGIQPFDDEGYPTNELALVKNGVVESFMHNTRTANKEDLESTGNASRAFGQPPTYANKPSTVGPHSPWILAGDMSEEEMIQETKNGIILHNYQGTVRYQNGIFSGVAKGAQLIENGEIVKPVTGISISGNVFDLLNNISGIGKEYHLANGWLTTPWLRFEGVKVSTK